MRRSTRPGHRPDRLGPLQRLDLGLLVHAEHDRVGRRVQVQPDHVADPRVQLRVGGELERLGLPGLDVVLGPYPGHRAVADAQLASQQPRGPMGHPKRLGRWAEGGGQDLGAPVAAHALGAATAVPVGQACGEPLTRIAPAPGDHRGSGDLQPLGDLAIGHPLGSQEQDLGPPDQRGRGLGGVRPAAQHCLVVGADRQGGGRQWHARMLHPADQPVKSRPLETKTSSM